MLALAKLPNVHAKLTFIPTGTAEEYPCRDMHPACLKVIEAFGELLDEAWQVKRGLHSVISNELVDRMYERALDAGAIGGKLLGAGSGGFLLLFVPPDCQDAVGITLSDHLTVRPHVNAPASEVIFDGMEMRRPVAAERKNGVPGKRGTG